ncbi:MAG: Alpha,alpha-trehalase [Patescibacteria group bacterium]|nr:alpha,alpha-trehalase [Candidatus Saccharibacteria bacterium]MDQ5963248.1 Alpha,alpha-trehalase [Patescibacteria group bacterium]
MVLRHVKRATGQAKRAVAIVAIDQIFLKPSEPLTLESTIGARQYIRDFWVHLERSHPNDDDSLLGLPNKYLVPSYDERSQFDFNEMYYWDSYFMVQGMLADTSPETKTLVVGILENLFALFRRFRSIPNASRTYLTGRSQPPFLTSFIREVYEAYDMDEEWLRRAMEVAQQEYEAVWLGVSKPNDRLVHRGLSRYYDVNYLHDLAEAESGWDMTPRFGRRALDFLPVDLNALLYKYEADFAWFAEKCGASADAEEWHKKMGQRKHTMEQLMWDKLRNAYYDYDYVKGKRSTVLSLATFFPMWAGMLDDQQAAKVAKLIRKFEHRGGLATTDALPINQYVPGALPVQWAYPNGWAPLHLIAVQALERYGYHEDAARIAKKWVRTNLDWFTNNGVFLEKYNVVNPSKPPQKGVYPSQTGFGWTNAVFERFCQEYID